jgi:hypothetical protein
MTSSVNLNALAEGLRLGLDFGELNKILEEQHRQLMQEENN